MNKYFKCLTKLYKLNGVCVYVYDYKLYKWNRIYNINIKQLYINPNMSKMSENDAFLELL